MNFSKLIGSIILVIEYTVRKSRAKSATHVIASSNSQKLKNYSLERFLLSTSLASREKKKSSSRDRRLRFFLCLCAQNKKFDLKTLFTLFLHVFDNFCLLFLYVFSRFLTFFTPQSCAFEKTFARLVVFLSLQMRRIFLRCSMSGRVGTQTRR